MIHPHIFRVSYVDDHHHRVDTCGGMDSEYSHTTRDRREEFVVAPDMETAQFLWNHQRRGIKSMTDVEWSDVGQVSILFAQGYGI